LFIQTFDFTPVPTIEAESPVLSPKSTLASTYSGPDQVARAKRRHLGIDINQYDSPVLPSQRVTYGFRPYTTTDEYTSSADSDHLDEETTAMNRPSAKLRLSFPPSDNETGRTVKRIKLTGPKRTGELIQAILQTFH